jgi:hypothetical protein
LEHWMVPQLAHRKVLDWELHWGLQLVQCLEKHWALHLVMKLAL